MQKGRIMLLTGLLLLAGLLLLVGVSTAGTVTWLDNFEDARKQAQKTKRPILATFTGSDWCEWCLKLDKEVFGEKIFQDYARAKLVLIVADYPSKKPQAARLIKQNEELQASYQVQGFPTVLLLDAQGKVLAQTGYLPGGAQGYVTHLRELLAQSGWTPPVGNGKTKGTPRAKNAPQSR